MPLEDCASTCLAAVSLSQHSLQERLGVEPVAQASNLVSLQARPRRVAGNSPDYPCVSDS